jgi:molecular chaperone HtpG
VNDLVHLVYEVSVVNSGFTLDDSATFAKRIFSIIKMNVACEEDEKNAESVDGKESVANVGDQVVEDILNEVVMESLD